MPPEPRLPAALARSLWLGAVLLALAEALAGAGLVPAPHRALAVLVSSDWPFFAFALTGSFVIHAIGLPGRRGLAWAVGLGAVLGVVLVALRPGVARHPLILAVNLGACLGAGSLLALGAAVVRPRPGSSARVALAVAACLPLYVLSINSYLELTSALHPRTPDLFAFGFDATLGGQPSFAVGRLFRAHGLLEVLSMLTYQALPVGAAAVVALLLRTDAERAALALWRIVLAGVFGFALYHVVPLAGPRAAFPDFFPHSVPQLAARPLELILLPPSVRNAMPSLHTAWALLVFWSSRGCGLPARLGAGFLLLFTLIGTLGSGEHYLIDLVVAVPFAVAVAAAAHSGSKQRSRVGLTTSCAALTGLWLVYLRLGEAVWRSAPYLNRSLVLLTVVAPLLAEWRMLAERPCVTAERPLE